MPPEVDALEAAIDAVAALDPAALTDDQLAEVVRRMAGAGDRFDAARLGLLGAFDARRAWAAGGHRSAAAWLSGRGRRDRSEGRHDLRLARALRVMPVVAAAFASGELTERHVSLLARAQRFAPDHFARDEQVLADQARTLTFTELTRAVAYWRQLADDDRAEGEAGRRRDRRHLTATKTLDGALAVDGWLDPIGGDIVRRELRRLERQLFEHDWAEARARLGDDARPADLARTSAQRFADALVEMARRSAHVPAGSTARRPLVSVLVDVDTLTGRVCELADGTVVTPGEVVPLLTEADVERAVFDPAGRVIDLGRRSRLFVGGARRAVELRDRWCTIDGCDVPAEECDVHHVPDWSDGGTTDPEHGELRCPAHHPGRRRPPDPPTTAGPAPADARRSSGTDPPTGPAG